MVFTTYSGKQTRQVGIGLDAQILNLMIATIKTTCEIEAIHAVIHIANRRPIEIVQVEIVGKQKILVLENALS